MVLAGLFSIPQGNELSGVCEVVKVMKLKDALLLDSKGCARFGDVLSVDHGKRQNFQVTLVTATPRGMLH